MSQFLSEEALSVAGIVRTQLGADDVIVLQTDREISQEMAVHIHDHAAKVFPDHKILVLGDGLRMSILGK